MKKICLDARLLGPSGIGTYLSNFLPFLLNENIDWTILIKKGTTFPYAANATLIETTTPIYSAKGLLLFHMEIPKCDIYWSPHFNLPLFPIPAKKILMTLCDCFHFHYYNKLTQREKLYTKYLIPRFAQRASQIITISEFSKKEIKKYIPTVSEKINVIPCAVDTQLFSTSKPSISFLRKHSLPSDYFLAVGSPKKHKNLDGLLLAFSAFLKKRKGNLVICSNNQNLLNQISLPDLISKNPLLKPHVHIVSNIAKSDMPKLYCNAKALIFPSFYEGFGLPPLEAMTSACPCILSDIEVHKEIYGSAAIYIYPNDPSSITNALIQIDQNKNLRDELIKKGLMQAEKYSLSTFAKAHIDLLKSM